MRRSQWFVLAIVFLLAAIILQYQGNSAYSYWAELAEENLKDLEKVQEENTWTEAFGIKYLISQNSADTSFIASQISFNFSNFCWAIFIACLICGFIEPRAEKRKKK